MTNFNGKLHEDQTNLIAHDNRGLAYGDAVFETIRVVAGKVYFWESHYLRLMASMRIMRMEIPMDFTMEFLEQEILKTLEAGALLDKPGRVKITVYRNSGGYYRPETHTVGYFIQASELEQPFYVLNDDPYEVDLFKDHLISPSLLSTVKTNNKALHVLGSIFANENSLDDCLLLNTDKMVAESLIGNLFLVKGKKIKTPPLSDGPLRGVTRKQLIEIIGQDQDYELQEASISPFELQKADELFTTNVIKGIVSITKYRKKQYTNEVAKTLIGKLNARARLG